MCAKSAARRSSRGTPRMRKPLGLALELLEARVVPTTRSWTGLSLTSNHWTDPFNWSNGAPAAGDDLVFTRGTPQVSNAFNDFGAGTDFHSISLNGVGSVIDDGLARVNLTGNAIRLDAGITDNTNVLLPADQDQVNLDSITLTQSQTFSCRNAFIAINSAINLNSFTLTLTGVSNNNSGTLGGLISGNGSLVKTGHCVWTLTHDNTYTGVTSIQQGFLSASANLALGSSTGANDYTEVLPGGSLVELSNNFHVPEPLHISGGGDTLAAIPLGSIFILSGRMEFSGTITLTRDATILANNIPHEAFILLGVPDTSAQASLLLSGQIDTQGHQLNLAGNLKTMLTKQVINSTQVGTGAINQDTPLSVGGSATVAGNVNVIQGGLSLETTDTDQTTTTPSTLVTTGNVDFRNPGTQLHADLGVPDSPSTSLLQAGTVDLTMGPTLDVALDSNFVSVPDQDFTIVQSSGGINGHFKDASGNELMDGSTLTEEGHTFIVRYLPVAAPGAQARSAMTGPSDQGPVGRVILCETPASTSVAIGPLPASGHFAQGAVNITAAVQGCDGVAAALFSSVTGLPANTVSSMDPVPGLVQFVYRHPDGSVALMETKATDPTDGVASDQPDLQEPGSYTVTPTYLGFTSSGQVIYSPSPPGTPVSFTVDQLAVVQFSSATVDANEPDGGDSMATIMVTRSGDTAGAASVAVGAIPPSNAIAGADYDLPASTTLTWAAGDASPKPFTITLHDDARFKEADERLVLQLVNPIGSILGPLATTTLTIHEDDDTPQAPHAVDDSYTGATGQTLTIPARGVLTNDAQSSGTPPLTALLVSGPQHGNLTLHSDGSFTYTPVANFVGQDSFTYQANDTFSDSNVATVTVSVEKTPPPPPTAVDDAYKADAGQALIVAASGVLANDKTASGNPLQASEVTGPQHGTLVLNSDGSFTYTASAGFTGQDSFTYKANDGLADSNVATVTVMVSPPPPPSEGQLEGVSTPAGVVLFAVRDNHAVYLHDASGWRPVGLNFIESISAAANASGIPVLFASTQGHDLFLFDPTKGLTNTGLRFIQALSATTDASGNPVLFVVTDAHDLFEYGPAIGLVNPHLSFIDQISATKDSAGNPVVFAITQGHDLFSFGATLGLVNLQSKFLTAISATHDGTTNHAALYALTQGHDLVYNDGAWHNLNSRFIQQISAGTGPSGQAEVDVITQANDLLRFDNLRGWVPLRPPQPVSSIQALDQDRAVGSTSDGSILDFDDTTGWINLGHPGG